MGTTAQDQWMSDVLGIKMVDPAPLASASGGDTQPQSAGGDQASGAGTSNNGQASAAAPDADYPDLASGSGAGAGQGPASFPAPSDDISQTAAEPTAGGEPPVGEPASGGPDLGDMVSAGTLAYTIFKDGAPTIDAKSTYNFALPKGKQTSDLDSSHRGDQIMVGTLVYLNMFGQHKCVDLKIRLVWEYGYSVNGKGRFITNAIVTALGEVSNPETVIISVQWGGWRKTDTPSGPIAQLPLTIIATVKNLMSTANSQWAGFISGDGSGRLDYSQ